MIRRDPFHDLTALQKQVNRLFGDTFGRLGDEGFALDAFEGGSWTPAVDIVERENAIVLRADLPGLDPKEVDINVHDHTLTIKGERKYESDVKEDDFRRVERVYGSFVRSFTLPDTVDTGKVEASYRHGVLELTLPKRPEAKPRQIKVAVK
ncbi:MAG: Hsp20/alpha crystallin family protein [Terriglobia bacterium]